MWPMWRWWGIDVQVTLFFLMSGSLALTLIEHVVCILLRLLAYMGVMGRQPESGLS